MEKKNDVLLFVSPRALISPFFRYSLKILEMNNIDLREHMEKCLNENPFLEDQRAIANFSDIDQFLETVAKKTTFSEEMYFQMLFLKLSDKEKETALLLLDGIIEHRYVTNDLLRRVSIESGMSVIEIFRLIKKLQQLSPRGLFSFNFKDKIKTSLEAENKYNKDYAILLQNLDMLPKLGLSCLSNKCNFDELRLPEMLSEIGRIDIIFDANVDYDDCAYRIPDMIIECKSKNDFEYNVNEYILPQLSVNRELYDESMGKCRSDIDKKYIQNNFSSAELLIKSVRRRNSTLLKILKELVYRQLDFFDNLDATLRPISVKSLANALPMHESTIHRAIQDKTVATPRGIFSLKDLMPKEIKNKTCENSVSDHSIKEYMKMLIGNEPKNSPYSDSNIVSLLNSRGVNISRRTVSKYRNAISIPNTFTRANIYKTMKQLKRE
ncbi:MAG: hypothetical protein LBD81_00065 [Holosporaceae bacterium]|jgi:RNA polymerase sigma-54 factor|nr:hypothetical protein [Holosporaceae bacterium]